MTAPPDPTRPRLAVRARLIREPDDESDFFERTQRALLLARQGSPENL
jgi:hypothetical protein